MNTVENIKHVINLIRPYIMADGGDLEFVDYVDGIVYIRMLGACAGCPMRKMTFNNGIKANIMQQISEVKDVVLVTD
ncbi:MAG TPA: NifU family protein [Erysipelotrichaceae bacterium]|jgi:Fe-S cluster biogenesis protein NfuA|nr:NifU family protein [Erysipelotrichia bacterium]HPX32980.1 NifU family protein [Erysipelotrichaceae bacterium]HQA85564.1 NifU family protein [Erysipelotrichaceae bacterium]